MIVKLLGALLLVVGGTCWAIGALRTKQSEIELLNEMIKALEIAKSELSTLGTALPELLVALAERCEKLGDFFLGINDNLDDELFCELWGKGLNKYGFCREAENELLKLGLSLGRYDVQSQCSAIENALFGLRAILNELKNSRKEKLRIFPPLGAAVGAFVAIMLL